MAETERWTVRKRAGLVRQGDRFIFASDLGGEGETVTVAAVAMWGGVVSFMVEEQDATIEATARTMLTLVLG